MNKKCLNFSLLAIFALFFVLNSHSQVVMVNLYQPPPNQWNVADLWNLTLTNTSSESLKVYLYGTVEAQMEGVIFEGTSAVFGLTPNFSGRIDPYRLEPADVGYANAEYEEFVMRTGTLPEGTYTICVYVKDANTDEELGRDCIVQPITPTSPPELINPQDEGTVTEELPIFLWTPPMPLRMGEFVTYKLKIVELLDGQVPLEAMEANPAWFTDKNIPATSFQLPISARPFEPAKEYAWQVTAFNKKQNYEIGESEVWSFTVGSEIKQCELYKVDLVKTLKGDTCFYKLIIVNNYQGNSTDYTPTSFKISIKKDSICSVIGEVPKGTNRTPAKMPPRTTYIKWKSKSGSIPKGEINLGLIYLGNTPVTPNYFIYEWLNINDTVICKDSCKISDPIKYYYHLTEELLDNYIDVSSDTLNVQYVNNYASIENIGFYIFDVESRKLVPGEKTKDVEMHSLNGLNRFSIDLKNYKLSPDRAYLLTVSDYISNYYFHFKVTSQNEK